MTRGREQAAHKSRAKYIYPGDSSSCLALNWQRLRKVRTSTALVLAVPHQLCLPKVVVRVHVCYLPAILGLIISGKS